MRGRAVALVGMEQGFVQFLAGAQAGVDDRDVAPGLLAGQADHLLGEHADRHRLAHVERVDRLLRSRSPTACRISWQASGIVMK